MTVVYTSNDSCLVYDYPSFCLIRYLDMDEGGDTERRVLDGFDRAVGIGDRWVSLEESKYFYDCISVSPGSSPCSRFFGRNDEDLRRAGIVRKGEGASEFFSDDPRYRALSERVRREFRTMYVVVVDWEGEVVDVFSIYMRGSVMFVLVAIFRSGFSSLFLGCLKSYSAWFGALGAIR